MDTVLFILQSISSQVKKIILHCRVCILIKIPNIYSYIGQKVAVKAMQKGKITDYEAFKNEINILMQLVSNVFAYNILGSP